MAASLLQYCYNLAEFAFAPLPMTSTEGRLKWINIVQQLRFNPGKFVRCPFCGASDLDVIDVSEDAESSVQWIACPKCNEATTLRSS
jgi:hypothetical protein